MSVRETENWFRWLQVTFFLILQSPKGRHLRANGESLFDDGIFSFVEMVYLKINGKLDSIKWWQITLWNQCREHSHVCRVIDERQAARPSRPVHEHNEGTGKKPRLQNMAGNTLSSWVYRLSRNLHKIVHQWHLNKKYIYICIYILSSNYIWSSGGGDLSIGISF